MDDKSLKLWRQIEEGRRAKKLAAPPTKPVALPASADGQPLP
jgi:hypothetical protein